MQMGRASVLIQKANKTPKTNRKYLIPSKKKKYSGQLRRDVGRRGRGGKDCNLRITAPKGRTWEDRRLTARLRNTQTVSDSNDDINSPSGAPGGGGGAKGKTTAPISAYVRKRGTENSHFLSPNHNHSEAEESSRGGGRFFFQRGLLITNNRTHTSRNS